MANYFVSVKRGSDSAGNGTASAPWKTIAKAIGASPAASVAGGGARVYLEPGTYYESVSVGLAPTAANPLEIVGDTDGSGFLAGGYATPAVGIVDWSGWTDDASSSTSRCIVGGAASYVSVRGIKFHGGQGGCVFVTTGSNWTLRDCILVAHPNSSSLLYFYSAPQALNLTIDRCDFFNNVFNNSTSILLLVPESTAEYNLGTSITNCRIFGGSRGIAILRSAATNQGFLGRGVTIRHCTFANCTGASTIFYQGVTTPLATACSVVGNAFLNCYSALEAGHTSHVSEDWNLINCLSPRTNTAAGPNSVMNVRAAVDRGDGRLVGLPLRPLLEPVPGSTLGGFVGATAAATTAVDLSGRSRPEGFQSIRAAAGAMERHDTGDADSTFADAGSPACLALRGPSSLERPVLIDATTTSIRVKVRWDGNHGDANKPQAILIANPEVGITADQVLTATSTGGTGATPNAYEVLTFAPVTPTRAGALMLRLVSRSSSGTGVAYFDSITLS